MPAEMCDTLLVLGCIVMNLGAVQRHMAQAHHPRLLAQPQNLHEHTLEGIEVAAAELTDAAVTGLLIPGQQPESQVLVTGPLDLAGRDGAHAVGVEHVCSFNRCPEGCAYMRGLKPFSPRGSLASAGIRITERSSSSIRSGRK